MVSYYRVPSAWGDWCAGFTEAGLREFHLPDAGRAAHVPRPCGARETPQPLDDLPELKRQEGGRGTEVRQALTRYLRGERAMLPWSCFDLAGCPPFFLRAWRVLHAIPWGTVRTYGEVAAAAGSPQAVRAAGQACGANPIVLFIPCHRVVAAGGLGGFSSGLEWKHRLLELEGWSTPCL